MSNDDNGDKSNLKNSTRTSARPGCIVLSKPIDLRARATSISQVHGK